MSINYDSNIPVVPGVLTHQSAVRGFISTIDSGTIGGEYNYWALEGGDASHNTLTVSTLIADSITSLTGAFTNLSTGTFLATGASILETPVSINNGGTAVANITATSIDLSGANVVVNTINGSAYPPSATLPQSNVAFTISFPATPVPPSGNPATSGTPLVSLTGLTFFEAGANYLVDIPYSFNATTGITQPITLGAIVGTGVGAEQVLQTITLVNGGGASGYQYQGDMTGVITVGPFNTGVLNLYAYNTDAGNTPILTGVAGGTLDAFFYKLSP